MKRRVTKHDAAAHRPPACDDVRVAQPAGLAHRSIEIEHFVLSDRGVTGRAAVAAEVETEHTNVRGKTGHDAADAGAARRQREAVRDDHSQRTLRVRAGQVDRGQPLTVDGVKRERVAGNLR